MRIMMVSHAFPPTWGGVETHLADLAEELAHRGHEIVCLVGGATSDEHWGRFSVHRRPAFRPEELLRTHRADSTAGTAHVQAIKKSMLFFLERHRPTVVHMHNAHHYGPQLAHGTMAAMAAHSNGSVVLNSVHDHTGEHVLPDVMDLPWDHLLYVSEFLRKALPGPAPATTLPLGIDLSKFSDSGPLHPALGSLERPVIFHPARPLPWKGVDVGLEAFIDIRRRLGRGTLVLCSGEQVVGDPEAISELKNRLLRRADQAGVVERVIYQDFAHEEMAAAYRSVDLVWYPTTGEEPYGLVPLEAMACGRPVVVSASGGLPEIVMPGRTGLIVPRGDIAALAYAALSVIEDAELRAEIVTAALDHVQRFSIEAYASRLEQVYRTGPLHSRRRELFHERRETDAGRSRSC